MRPTQGLSEQRSCRSMRPLGWGGFLVVTLDSRRPISNKMSYIPNVTEVQRNLIELQTRRSTSSVPAHEL